MPVSPAQPFVIRLPWRRRSRMSALLCAAVVAVISVALLTGSAASTAAASLTYNIWPSQPAPWTPIDPDTASVELGVTFQSQVTGAIEAIKFYRAADDRKGHTVTLWSSDGTVLGTGRMSARANGPGWRQV